MQIQQTQKYNTNFQGLYGSKRALKSLEKPLRTEIEDLAKNCDVLVEIERPILPVMTLSTLPGVFIGTFGSQLMSLKTAIPTAIASTFAIATTIIKMASETTIQIGERVIKDLNTNKLKIDGIKSDKISLDEEANIAKLKKEYIDKVTDNGSAELLKEYMKNGFINLLNYNKSFMKKRFSENEYQGLINEFAKLQLTKDSDGNLPIHKVKNSSTFSHINDYLENNMEELSEIYLTKNNNGELPIHKIMHNVYTLKEISSRFENYPRVLATIFTAKNPHGENVIDTLKKISHQGDTYIIEHIIKKVENATDYCTKVRGKFIPAIAKTEKDMLSQIENIMSSDMNFQNIMEILKNKNIQSTKGYLLNNDDYLNKIIDFTINGASKDETKAIIKELQKLSNIDFNKVDENNISIVEKIINTENPDLLTLFNGRNLEYYPELDYAYERIENSDFKRLVKDLNFEFKDLENTVNVESMRGLDILSKHFKSPLFKKDYNGKILLDVANKTTDSNFKNKFMESYGQYLSDYIV